MTHEIDLPCSDCGTDLVERTVEVRELALSDTGVGAVTVAACPSCGARYYPREALAQLFGATTGSSSRGEG